MVLKKRQRIEVEGVTSLDPREVGLDLNIGRVDNKAPSQPCTIRAPLLSLLPTELVARQVKFPASFMSTLLISREAVPSTNAIWYLSEAVISLPSLTQETRMGREPAILQSNLQAPLTTLSRLRKGLVKNGAMSRSVCGGREKIRSTWPTAQWFIFGRFRCAFRERHGVF